MKNLIKRILTETTMGKLINDVFPQLNNLKSKKINSQTIFGENRLYYDQTDNEYYFRVSEPRRAWVWSFDENGENPDIRHRDFPKTLYINGGLYDDIKAYIPSDDMILKWFNEKYNQNAELMIRRSPLKGR
jgi:hypothetical protein